MRYSVSDFIDSDTLRSHLQEKTLEPAIECILIAQSEAQPLQKKLEALQERYDTYSNGQFAEGIYHAGDQGSFKDQLGCFIIRMREELERTETPDDESGAFVYYGDDGDYNCGVFDSFKAACEMIEPGRAVIVKQKTNAPDYPRTVYVMNTQEINRIILSDDSLLFDLPEAYAEIPHEYRAGDIITSRRTGDHYVLMHAEHLTEKPQWLNRSDYSDMQLYCLRFTESPCHTGGGSFDHCHVRILDAEIEDFSALPQEQQPLLALSLVIQEKMRLSDFLEAYSNGMLHDLMKYYRDHRAENASDLCG